MAAVLKFCRWGEKRAIPCCLYIKEALQLPCWGAACPGNGCPMGSGDSLWKQIPKVMGYVGKYLGIVLFCCCFGGGRVLVFTDFFVLRLNKAPWQRAAQRPAAALLAPLSLLCHLPVLLLTFSLCGSPRAGIFPADLLDSGCTLPQPPQCSWIPPPASVLLLLRSPTAASRAGTCWGELPSSPLLFALVCFPSLVYFFSLIISLLTVW